MRAQEVASLLTDPSVYPMMAVGLRESYRLTFALLFLNHFLKTTTIRIGGQQPLEFINLEFLWFLTLFVF